ncbi:MAG: TlpA family protein disulfide reductase [Prevotella sp.]|nr:TlpA family protein disulfide reductase [Prevotella sp.]
MKKLMTTCSLLFILTVCAADDEVAATFLPLGTEAPEITIYTADCPDGLTLSSLRGRYVVIEFWASWCPDCRKVTTDMKEMYAAYASDSLLFVGISFDTDEAVWRNYIAENSLPWIQYSRLTAWKENEIAAAYNIKWIPTFYLIDPAGNIAFATIEISEMRTELEGLFGEK